MKKLFLFLSFLSFATNSVAADKSIVTSFYPLAYMTEQIAGDKADVINLAGSIDVHSYEPSPRDLVKLNKADLVIYQGAELESWINGVIPGLKEKGISTLEVTHDLTLAKLEEHDEHGDEHKEEKHDDHKDEHGKENKEKHDDHDNHKDDEHKDEHDEHHHGEFDPHTWLDPVLAQQMVDGILEAMVKVDSANEALYKANAKTLKDRFNQLDQNFAKNLAECKNNAVIISHDAYGYITKRYGFKAHGITGLSSQDEPSAKILAGLKKEAEKGITYILVEENKTRRFADTLARETGLKTLPANPLGRGALDPKKDFFDVMEENLNSFKTALNCQ